MLLIDLHQSRHAVCLAEAKIISTYYHFLDVLLIHTLIKLLNLACTALAFPNNALTKTNIACRLVLKRNNHSITCFSVVMHTSPRVQGVQSHIAGKYLQQKFPGKGNPISRDSDSLTSGSRWKVSTSQHYLQRLLSLHMFRNRYWTHTRTGTGRIWFWVFSFTQSVARLATANPGNEISFSALPESPVAPSS